MFQYDSQIEKILFILQALERGKMSSKASSTANTAFTLFEVINALYDMQTTSCEMLFQISILHIQNDTFGVSDVKPAIFNYCILMKI